MDYYYQIKIQSQDQSSLSRWAFPPIFSGKVSANSKSEAKQLIEQEYERKFPLRVLEKNLANEPYLLNIQEISVDDERTQGLFEFRNCLQCNQKFRVIDLYNDHNEIYKGKEYCSFHCKEVHRLENTEIKVDGWGRNSRPIIYQITNIQNGLSYIGKTTQVFTLRWYQHFYQGGSCKFHQAIKDSKVEDWQFRVLEISIPPSGVDKDEYLACRERFWIEKLDTIDNGYNSL